MLRVTALISDDHTFDECEIQLYSTMYVLHTNGRDIYATVDVSTKRVGDSVWYNELCDNVGDDLLVLGLLTEWVTCGEIV